MEEGKGVQREMGRPPWANCPCRPNAPLSGVRGGGGGRMDATTDKAEWLLAAARPPWLVPRMASPGPAGWLAGWLAGPRTLARPDWRASGYRGDMPTATYQGEKEEKGGGRARHRPWRGLLSPSPRFAAEWGWQGELRHSFRKEELFWGGGFFFF